MKSLNLKIKKGLLFVFFVAAFFVKIETVFAVDLYGNSNGSWFNDGNVGACGGVINNPCDHFHGQTDVKWAPAWHLAYKSGTNEFMTTLDTSYYPSGKTCFGSEGFCDVAITCGTNYSCFSALAKTYDQKAYEKKQATIDASIKSAGIDSTIGSAATDVCNGDLVCVANTLSALGGDQGNLATQSESTDPTVDVSGADAVNGKQQGPVVKVAFGALNGINDGEKITATATPGGFSDTDAKKLYFTWYIRQNNPDAGLKCDLTKSGEKLNDENKNCDLDGDEMVTENDWKIAAARINLRGDFDVKTADYSKDLSSDKIAGAFAIPAVDDSGDDKHPWKRTYDHDLSNDENAQDCYVQDSETGDFYELRDTSSSFGSCPSGTHLAYVEDNKVSCDVTDSSVTPVATTTKNDLNACKIGDEAKNSADTAWGEKQLKCNADFSDFTTSVVASENSTARTPICALDGGVNEGLLTGLASIIFGKSETVANVCSKEILKTTNSAILFGNTDLATCASTTKKIFTADSTRKPTCSYSKGNNFCKHLFPYFPEKDVVGANGKNITLTDDQRRNGTGKFDIEQKEFWGGNPTTDKTNVTNKDGAVVIGLGIDKFEWNYSEGDEVGVVVEGESLLPTKHIDSSYMTMWAFSKGICSKLSDISHNAGGDNKFYKVSDSIKILTTNFDLDKCLEENLLNPKDSSSLKMEVQLNATPTNPINDESGKGDDVVVSANTTNIKNYQDLFYTWTIEKSLDGSIKPTDQTNWVDITSQMEKTYASFPVGSTQGFGKTSFVFNLNLPDNDFLGKNILNSKKTGAYYLKIKTRAEENNGKLGNSAMGSVVIKIIQQQNKILIFPVSVDTNGKLNLNEGSSSLPTELSALECDSSACYVTKNEIVGIKIPDAGSTKLSGFTWKINGNDFVCSSNISNACEKVGSNTLFFPVLGNVGESVDVVAKAKNETTGTTVEVSKHFVIVAPSARIVSADTNLAWPKILGHYLDTNGQPTITDYSSLVLQTRFGNKIVLRAQFYPASKAGQVAYAWTIDGQLQDTQAADLPLEITKFSGDSYSIGLSAMKIPGANEQAVRVRNALRNNWGVVLDDTTEINQNTSIQLDVLSALAVAKEKQTGNFAASLVTHLPEQLVFLFKIILTAVILLGASAFVFAFMPSSNTNKLGSERY